MADPVSTTQITSNIPDWAKDYATRLLGEAEAYSRQGFDPYKGQMYAGFNPLQTQAFIDVAGMTPAAQLSQATGFAGLAGLQAQRAGEYDPMKAQNYYQFRDQSITRPGTTQQFMSPYMQNVVNTQKQQAIQDYARQIPTLQSQGIRAGARGGTREALVQSEAQRNLQNQLGNIQATGLQNAYQAAQQQFNTEQAARQQSAAARAQYGLGGAQLGEQSRQFGAGLGIQGIQQQLAAAQQLGALGQEQYQQGLGINTAQQQAGSQIQNLEQQNLANQYQQFLNAQQQPYQRLSWFSDILRGTPSSAATQNLYQAPPNVLGQVAGLGLGLGSLFGGGK